jgi:hypothetical protein
MKKNDFRSGCIAHTSSRSLPPQYKVEAVSRQSDQRGRTSARLLPLNLDRADWGDWRGLAGYMRRPDGEEEDP